MEGQRNLDQYGPITGFLMVGFMLKTSSVGLASLGLDLDMEVGGSSLCLIFQLSSFSTCRLKSYGVTV